MSTQSKDKKTKLCLIIPFPVANRHGDAQILNQEKIKPLSPTQLFKVIDIVQKF